MAYTRKARRARAATSIPIDPDKMRAVLRRRFLTQEGVSESMGKCKGWMAVALNVRRINFYALDDLAGVLDMTFEDLFDKVVDEEEWLGF